MLDELLCLLPSVLINNHERRQGAELRETVDGVRVKLEETLAASEKEKVRMRLTSQVNRPQVRCHSVSYLSVRSSVSCECP